MYNYIGLFIVRHSETKEIEYQQRQMFSDVIPSNNTHDIMMCVKACNDEKLAGYAEFEYLDMYGIVVDDQPELWEND